jgi:hypothetical protein
LKQYNTNDIAKRKVIQQEKARRGGRVECEDEL